MQKLNAIDLFSGCGGLSLGLKKAGFDVLAAVEIDKRISETYKANHPETYLFAEDIRNIKGSDIIQKIKKQRIHLVAGCPPCQGFSQLTEKYKKEDVRNSLPLEMARIIKEIKPDMVMLENVPGLSKKGKIIFNKFISQLEEEGYLINYGVLQIADYGVPQSRKRLVLLAGKGFKINLPEQTHSNKGEQGFKKWVTLKKALEKIKNKPVSLSYALKHGGPAKYNWHVVRNIKKRTLKRLMALKEGDNRLELPVFIRPKCHKGKGKGFQNVYGRMEWNVVSPTITSGCTTLSMGRFGHPTENRTISIREAALIQTFPKNYKFCTNYMGLASLMIGNALPPKFVEAAANVCRITWKINH